MTLMIHELLARDPTKDGLANDGQARIRNEHTTQAVNELKAELSSFVCDGQYGDAMNRILTEYIKRLNKDRQLAAWISGFYGSGKSHLLKMLGHLWQNTEFPDGSSARGLVVGLPSEVHALLKELDQAAKRCGVSRFAAMGQLPAGSGDFVRATIASVVLEARNLPAQVQLAEFVFWLRSQGIDAQVKKDVEAAGKDWLQELESLYVSPLLAKAVLQAMPTFALTEAEARKAFAAQYPALKCDLTSNRFVAVIRQALTQNDQLPLTVIVLDEIQQYIADSSQRAADVTEAIETLYTKLDSRVIVIGAGQSALSTSTPTLLKLRDRFAVTAQLSDSDVEAVTRRVVLFKKPTHELLIRTMLESHAGEIARHLKSAPKLAARSDDSKTQVVDYPLLPTRRRFWEECFRAVDSQGSQSQLRSQLKVLHQSVKACAEQPLGHVIPADALYAQIADKLVNTGVLLNELHTKIAKLDDGTAIGQLRQRACSLVFLIMKLPRETGVDLGVRATQEVVADLMISDLTTPSAAFRNQVAGVLDALVAEGSLMKVADEYRLQTAEGAEWERAFRERVAQLTAQPEDVEAVRVQRFKEVAQSAISQVRIKQGVSKVTRAVSLHYESAAPIGGEGVVVWVRDGWSASEKEVLSVARENGIEDPMLYVFVPKKEADALRRHITDAVAAQRTLDNKGAPTNPEGHEAYASISSRKMASDRSVRETIADIFSSARVFQGGGNEIALASLADSIQDGAKAAIARRYPRFGEADFVEWETVIQRSKTGADTSFVPIGHHGAVEDHSVSREVLRVMGNGAVGSKIRKDLNAAPFGWPNDAIDAALITMHRLGIVKAHRSNKVLAPGQLDQSSIPLAEFKREQTVVSTKQRIAVRSFCSHCMGDTQQGDDETKAGQALRALADLAKAAGGDAPAPASPNTASVQELSAFSGADLLVAVAAKADDLKALWTEWKKLEAKLALRLDAWSSLVRLADHAIGIEEAADARGQRTAIFEHRALLQEPDPVPPLTKTIAALLRGKLQCAQEEHERAVATARQDLAADASWCKLEPVQQSQLLADNKIAVPCKPNIATDEELIAALDGISLDARSNLATVVTANAAKARNAAAKHFTPTARQIPIASATLTTEADVHSWIAARKAQLLEEIKKGPVILG